VLTTVLALCVAGSPSLVLAKQALANFRAPEALELLTRARGEGPHAHREHVELYEQLGIAHAYLGHVEESRAAFVQALLLEPSLAISYTLSPKVTFVFEQAREVAAQRGAAALGVGWPSEPSVSEDLPIDLEILADPGNYLVGARVFYRWVGDANYLSRKVALGAPQQRVRVLLPAPMLEKSAILELYVVAEDAAENQVLLWRDAGHPLQLPLRYDPPRPWFTQWWVLAAVGAVAAGATTAVLIATHEPSALVGGEVRVER